MAKIQKMLFCQKYFFVVAAWLSGVIPTLPFKYALSTADAPNHSLLCAGIFDLFSCSTPSIYLVNSKMRLFLDIGKHFITFTFSHLSQKITCSSGRKTCFVIFIIVYSPRTEAVTTFSNIILDA